MRVIRGLLALVFLAVVIVGVPYFLVTLAGNPLPSLETLSGLLSHPDYGGRFLFGSLLPIAIWVLWIPFPIVVVSELVARARGMRVPRFRGLGWQQIAAAGLVAAVLAMFTLGSLASATTAQAAPDSTVKASVSQTLPSSPEAPSTAKAPTPEPTKQAERGPTYKTKAGDTLWKIAAKKLGDSTKYPEIAQLNQGRIQPDGQVFTDGDWIQPGWILELPPSAQPPAAQTDATHTVKAGDSLTSIAEQYTGSPEWQPLFDASKDLQQPQGEKIQDPSLIKPGWTIKIPAELLLTMNDASPARAQPAVPAAQQSPAAPIPQPAPAQHEAPEAPPAALGVPGVSASAEPSATETKTAGESSSEAADAADDGFDISALRTIGGLGAVVAVGLIGLINIRRLLQRKNRHPGKKIAMPAAPEAATERQLRSVEDIDGVKALNESLQYLTIWAQDSGKVLPQMFSARISPEEIGIYLAEPAELPPPFVKPEDANDGSVWCIDIDAIPELERLPSAPYPALVSLGRDGRGAELLFELEYIGSLEIAGPADLQQQVLKALALELATSEWGQEMQITLVGASSELTRAISTGRLRHVDDIEQLMQRLRGKAASTKKAFAGLGVTTVEQARALGPDAQSWMPEIVILGTALPEENRQELLELVSEIPRMGIAAISASQTSPDERSWTLNLDQHTNADGETETTATLSPLGITLDPSRCSAEEEADLLSILRTTDAEDEPGWAAAAAMDASETPVEEVLTDDDRRVQETITTINGSSDPSAEFLEPVQATAAEATANEDIDNQAPGVADTDVSEHDNELVRAVLGKPTTTELEPIVCVLGEVLLRGIRGDLPMTAQQEISKASVARATALTAYIALNPGASAEQYHDAFWPNQHASGKTASSNRNKLTNITRRMLGINESGEPYLPHATQDGYNLAPEVMTDWQLFLDLVGEDLTQTSTERLSAAIRLVRGQPFEGAKATLFAWAEEAKSDMCEAICDAAHELANRALRHGNAAQAKLAADISIKVNPMNEAGWRNAMKAEHIKGNKEGIKEIAARLTEYLDSFNEDYEPDEETQELISELLGQKAVA